MSEETEVEQIEPRDIDKYFPFVLPVNFLPTYFWHNLEKKTLVVKGEVFLLKSDFNNYGESFKLLNDEAAFSGSIYTDLLTDAGINANLNVLSGKAIEVAKFKTSDILRQIVIDTHNTKIDIIGERIIGESATDLLGDPSKTFGAAQNKFTRLIEANPELVQIYYGLILGIFAQKVSPRQKFYQALFSTIQQ